MKVLVTDHALARYRERVALYGDAKADEIAAAVNAATPVDPAEPLPDGVYCRPGYRAFRHAEKPGVFFIAAATARGVVTVVSVIDTTPPAFAAPKVRVKEKRRAREAAAEKQKKEKPPEAP